MRKGQTRGRQVAVSEATLQRAAARVLPDAKRLVSTEISYLQRVLGTSALQSEIDTQVVAVRRLPWVNIALPE
jgi:hypothetical protein